MEHNRRGILECMVWAGAGLVWTMQGGVPRSSLIGDAAAAEPSRDFSFVQISDSHIGFAKPPNMDTPGTLHAAIEQVRAIGGGASMMIHTGDVSHLSREDQFDTAAQIIGQAGLQTHYVPGEHDVLDDDGRGFFARFTKGGPRGWYSFDQQGVHFIGLNNVQNLKAGGMGDLGADQLAWLDADLRGRAASQPIVVFAHMPLWTVYAPWGWGTDDAAQALSLLARFGSVTVLNGHIHQIMQKVEGNVAFHTARSTAFPQPAPGSAPSPGPMKQVPPGRLHALLGVARIAHVQGARAAGHYRHTAGGVMRLVHLGVLGCAWLCLAGAPAPAGQAVSIDNFAFSPAQITVAVGETVVWTNRDDIPHTVTSADTPRAFKSGALDTDGVFSRTFDRAGRFAYFCSLHAHMQGVVVVK